MDQSLCSRLANRRIMSINSKYRVRHNWNRNPEGEHFHIKSLPDNKGVLEYLFSRIDIYLFLLISKVLEFKLAFYSFNQSILSLTFPITQLITLAF